MEELECGLHGADSSEPLSDCPGCAPFGYWEFALCLQGCREQKASYGNGTAPVCGDEGGIMPGRIPSTYSLRCLLLLMK